MSYYDVRDALMQPGCPVCSLGARDTERYLDSLLWEHVNDPDVRQSFCQSHGFCHKHAWQLDRAGASLGVAILLRDVVEHVLETMEDGGFQALPTLSFRRAQEALDPKHPAAATADLVARLTAKTECPVCRYVKQMEAIYLTTMLDHLMGQVGLLAAYQKSDGLCLPHFRQALAQVRDQTVFTELVNAQQTIWRQLAEDLTEFIRKNNARFREESWGDEGDAWLRAIASLTGDRWASIRL